MKRELFVMCLLALAGGASAQTVTQAPSTIRPVQAPIVTVPPATTPDPKRAAAKAVWLDAPTSYSVRAYAKRMRA